tara:strand:+ start:3175 stop:4698 length:1524 start_codon:yes stop_codon:yes gene_type:complete
MTLRSYYIGPATATLPAWGLQFGISEQRLPLTFAAVQEVSANTKAPQGLALMAALTCQSVALQGLVDVELPIGKRCPVSIMALAIAVSGERKTGVENAFLEPIRRYQREQRVLHEKCLEEWQLIHDVWTQAMKVKKREIAKLKAAKANVTGLLDELTDLSQEEPVRPREFKLLYDDATVEALLHGMNSNHKNAALVSSEGGSLLKGYAFQDLALLNSLWGGADCSVDRRSSESFQILSGRLTLSMMVQPSSLQAYLENKGEESRGSGLWARFICFSPESTQGTRFENGFSGTWEALASFSDRAAELLDAMKEKLEQGSETRLSISFDADASAYFTAVSNSIEQEIRPGGRFEGLNDHASKLAENIARVAALLHAFENGLESRIGIQTLYDAIAICFRCSDEFSRIFREIPQVVRDAEELSRWFQKFKSRNIRYIKQNSVLQLGPSCGRKKSRRNDALEYLAGLGFVRVVQYGRIKFIDFDPYLLGDSQRLQNDTGVFVPYQIGESIL